MAWYPTCWIYFLNMVSKQYLSYIVVFPSINSSRQINQYCHHVQQVTQLHQMEKPQYYKTSDALSPYFLHSVDHPGVVLVSTPLNGENYTTLKRAMKMALNAKNNLGFVDGTLTKPKSNNAEILMWERCNDMELSWILNSIEKSFISSIMRCT